MTDVLVQTVDAVIKIDDQIINVELRGAQGPRGSDGDSSQLVPLTHQVGSTANELLLTPGEAPLVDAGINAAFVVIADEDHDVSGVSVEIEGVNDADPRELVYPNGESLFRKAFKAGAPLLIKYVPDTGLPTSLKFVLMSPAPRRVDFIPLVQVNGDPAVFACRMADATIPFDGASQACFSLPAPTDRQAGEFTGVTLEIEGLNGGDQRQVRYYPGHAVADQIGPYAWKEGDMLLFGPLTADGWFPLIYPPPPPSAPVSSTMSTYQRIALRGAAQNASAALRLAGS